MQANDLDVSVTACLTAVAWRVRTPWELTRQCSCSWDLREWVDESEVYQAGAVWAASNVAYCIGYPDDFWENFAFYVLG